MSKAERKYQTRILNGEWNTPTQEQTEIIALKAKLAIWNQGKQVKDAHFKRNAKGTRKPIHDVNKSEKKVTVKVDQSWRHRKPQAHEQHTKKVNGSTWHFCVHHQAWGRHASDTCRKVQSNSNQLEASLAHIGIKGIIISDDDSNSHLQASLAHIGVKDTATSDTQHQTTTNVWQTWITLSLLLCTAFTSCYIIGNRYINKWCLQTTTKSRHCIEELKTKTTNLLSALHTTSQTHNNRINSNHTNLKFDTDSYLIGIDNHASASMTNSETDFINPPVEVNLKIKGINGHLHTTKVGTVR
jgi:hypothetical protein